MYHGVTFNLGSVKMFSPTILEKCFSYDKDIWIAATDYYIYFYIYTISIERYSPMNKFYSFIIFSLLINAVILLLQCLIVIPYLCTHLLPLRRYWLYLNIIWTCV